MKFKLEWSIGLAVLAVLAFGILVAIIDVAEKDAEIMTRRATLSAMERVGEVTMNRSSVYLWGFDFEGRRCLWATTILGNGGRAGLTCWEKK